MIEVTKHMTPADVAYQLLKQEARAMSARDLIDSIIKIMSLEEDDSKLKAKVYTSINLDPRMVFLGKGVWGIRDWSPSAIAAATAMPDLLPGEGSYQPRAGDYLWDDDEDEDDDEEASVSVVEDEPEEPVQP